MSKNQVRMLDLPPYERPYERFWRLGAEDLTDTELLSILIKSGSRSKCALHVASQILTLDLNNEGPAFLCNLPLEDLMSIEGIGRVKAATIKAAVELGRRASRMNIHRDDILISSPADVADYFREEMQYLKHEELRIMLLDSGNRVIRVVKGASGTARSTKFSARDIFKDAIKYDASAIVLVHNHPSGNLKPSLSDIKTTGELEKIASELDISLLDHLIMSKNGYISIKMSGHKVADSLI